MATSSFLSAKNQDLLQNQESDLALELIINRMEDGFSKIYVQLEALDDRISEIQGISDKVDMLEASVRLLENHAFLWPMVNQSGQMADKNSSSSSVHSVSTPTLVQRSLKRNHTIGNIKYDSSAYKVSFKMDVEDSTAEASESENKFCLGDPDYHQNNSDFLVPNIVRSKSFSNDYKTQVPLAGGQSMKKF